MLSYSCRTDDEEGNLSFFRLRVTAHLLASNFPLFHVIGGEKRSKRSSVGVNALQGFYRRFKYFHEKVYLWLSLNSLLRDALCLVKVFVSCEH